MLLYYKQLQNDGALNFMQFFSGPLTVHTTMLHNMAATDTAKDRVEFCDVTAPCVLLWIIVTYIPSLTIYKILWIIGQIFDVDKRRLGLMDSFGVNS